MKFREWRNVTLKDVLKDKGYIRGPFGSALKRGEMKMEGIPVYEQANAIDNHRNFRYFVDEEKYESLQRFTVNEDDLIISCSGTVGKISIISKNDPVGIISQALLILRTNTAIILPKYLYYFFNTREGLNSILSRSSGSVQVNIAKRAVIEDIKLYLPPIEEQKSISHILSTLDEKIEVNNQINKKLEEMAQTIFKHWFVDFEFPNENGEPYKSSGGEMVDSELGMIPKGWEVKELEDIAIITMGQSPKGSSYNEHEDGTVFYQGRTDFTNRFPIRRLYTTEPKRIAKTGDILMSVRAPVGDINIANEECCIGRGLCSFRSKNSMNSYLLYMLLNLKEKFDVFNGEGTVFGSINQKDLKGIKIIMPNDSIVKDFNDIATSLDKKYLYLEMESRKLTQLRDTLLPKLMSGKLRIPLEEGDIS